MISSHATSVAEISCFFVLGSFLSTLSFNNFHKFSIGLRSGEALGHGMASKLCSAIHRRVTRPVWAVTLSCKSFYPSGCSTSACSIKHSPRMAQYCSQPTLPSKIFKENIPLLENAPQTPIDKALVGEGIFLFGYLVRTLTLFLCNDISASSKNTTLCQYIAGKSLVHHWTRLALLLPLIIGPTGGLIQEYPDFSRSR